ncbi:MAG: hypothetical protein ACERKN_10810 [Velocimicrobium sp.]
MNYVITIGETMTAFLPDSNNPLRYVSKYHMKVAGAKSNTAIGLAKRGHNVSWFSRLEKMRVFFISPFCS